MTLLSSLNSSPGSAPQSGTPVGEATLPNHDAWRYPAGFNVELKKLRTERITRTREMMQAHEIPALVLFDPINIRYVTDSTNMQVWILHNMARCLFVPLEGPIVLFDSHGGQHLSAHLGTVDEVRRNIGVYYFSAGERMAEKAQTFVRVIEDLMNEHAGGSRRLGVDAGNSTVVLALAERGFTVRDGQRTIERARCIKTPEELKAMAGAIDVCQASMARMHEKLVPGITEVELWSWLHQANIAQGGEWIETRLLAAGSRTNPWFQEASFNPIQAGDMVSYDTDLIGPWGYCCDISRSLICGDVKPSDEQKRLYNLAYAILQHNLEILKPGMSFREFAEKSYPLPEAFVANRYSAPVHGIGLCDEYPHIVYLEDWDESGEEGLVEPNMTLCLEAYIGREGGREGVKLEEQVLVTDKGAKLLSSFPFETSLLG